MSRLTVSFLGAPRIERDGVPVALDSRKAVALLAYLAITHEHHSREALMTLLWPESDQVHAQNTLRYTLSVLKKAIGVSMQRRQDGTHGLRPAYSSHRRRRLAPNRQ